MEWKEEFNERFSTIDIYIGKPVIGKPIVGRKIGEDHIEKVLTKEVIDFITTLLEEQQDEFKKMVEGMKQTDQNFTDETPFICNNEYNQALDDLLTKLN